MLEMLRKKLIDAGIDPAVGSMDYWGTQLEGVLLDMYDLGAAAEREACVKIALRYEPIERSRWVKYAADEMRARGNNENAPLP